MAPHAPDTLDIKAEARQQIQQRDFSQVGVLTPQDLYSLLGGRNRTYWLLSAGHLPAQRSRKGGVYRMLVSALHAWLSDMPSQALHELQVCLNSNHHEQWLTLVEAAVYLRVHLTTARRWIEGHHVHTKVERGRLWIAQSALERSLLPPAN